MLLLILFNQFAIALELSALSRYMIFGFPLLEISFLKLLVKFVVLRFGNSSRCTATGKQEVSDDLSVFVLNLKIVSEKSKALTRPRDKRDVTLWKEAPYCM